MKIDPFKQEIVTLRVPLTVGERTIKELVFNPPKVKDLLAAGKYPEGSVLFTFALLCSLTGEPEIIMGEMFPEDWADCLVILNRTYQRFTGVIDLFDQKDGAGKNPTTAGVPPRNSSPSSAA